MSPRTADANKVGPEAASSAPTHGIFTEELFMYLGVDGRDPGQVRAKLQATDVRVGLCWYFDDHMLACRKSSRVLGGIGPHIRPR